jgi:hypothetical protein
VAAPRRSCRRSAGEGFGGRGSILNTLGRRGRVAPRKTPLVRA